jgi:hypothetical protein
MAGIGVLRYLLLAPGGERLLLEDRGGALLAELPQGGLRVGPRPAPVAIMRPEIPVVFARGAAVAVPAWETPAPSRDPVVPVAAASRVVTVS